jgi:hypothetical protein
MLRTSVGCGGGTVEMCFGVPALPWVAGSAAWRIQHFHSATPPLANITQVNRGHQMTGNNSIIGSSPSYSRYGSFHYNLLFVVEVANELKVVRMASATPSGFTCGARCPPCATRWTEAALPLNAFLCISSLTGPGLTTESAVPEVGDRMCCFGSHVIVDSSPNDMHGCVRTQCTKEVECEHLAGPVVVRYGFLGFRTLEGHTWSIAGIILGCLPKAELLQRHQHGWSAVQGETNQSWGSPTDHEEFNHPFIPCPHPFRRKGVMSGGD